MNRTIVIGDVHGCLDETQRLLREVGYSASDSVVFVGDLVAKGPDSRGVIAFLKEIGARSVLGNHDDALLKLESAVLSDRDRTPKDVNPVRWALARTFSPEDFAFLGSLPLWIELEEFESTVFHAGALDGLAMRDQAREHLLTLRSVRQDGTGSKRIDDGVPWASLWNGPRHIVFGHDAMRGRQVHKYAVGLDTGCVYGGRLTAWLLPERRFVSVAATREWATVR